MSLIVTKTFTASSTTTAKPSRGKPADYLAEAKGESESVAGLMLELFSKMPATGEQISWRGLSFTIAAVDQKRIKQVRVLLKEVTV